MPGSAEKGWRGQSGFDDASKSNKPKKAVDSFKGASKIEGKPEKKPDAAGDDESGLSALEQAEINVDAFAELLGSDAELKGEQKDKMLDQLDSAIKTFEDTMLEYADKITDEEKKRLLTGMEKALIALEQSTRPEGGAVGKAAKSEWAGYKAKLKDVSRNLDRIEDEDRKKGRRAA